MLVTGSSYKGIKSVSIRVSSDGLSFFNTKGDCLSGKATPFCDIEKIEQQIKYLRKLSSKLTLISESDHFVMIPKELYNSDCEYAYFMAKTLPYDSMASQFVSVEVADAVVIISLEKELMDMISLQFDQIEISHPVIQTLEASITTERLVFNMTESERCAISYSSGGELKFADYLPATTIIDIVYYIQRMIARFSIDQSEEIGYIGSVSRQLTDLMAQNIKNPISNIKTL